MVDGTRVAHLEFKKNIIFRNFSKTTWDFFLIVYISLKIVLKTSFGKFWIWKIGKFSNTKISNFIFGKKYGSKKTAFREYLKKNSNIFFWLYLAPTVEFKEILWYVLNWAVQKIFHKKMLNFIFWKIRVEKNMLFGNISKTSLYFFLIVFSHHRRVFKTL